MAGLYYLWVKPELLMGQLTPKDMLLRVGMAFVAGFLVGWERESHGRPAGLRTTILTCVAAAVAMILSEVLFIQSAAIAGTSNWRPDPARLGAGILTGIGFLGAGTILRHAHTIRGVTTAASLWFVTVLGLAFGSGAFTLGFIGAGVAFLSLLVLARFEKHMLIHVYSTLTVIADFSFMNEADFRRHIEALGPKVKALRLQYDVESRRKTFSCDLQLTKAQLFQVSATVVSDLSKMNGVSSVSWN